MRWLSFVPAAKPRVGKDEGADVGSSAAANAIGDSMTIEHRDTRAVRIEKTLSKLRSGRRAACCFNRSQRTDPSISHNGVLLDPTPTAGESERRQARSRRT